MREVTTQFKNHFSLTSVSWKDEEKYSELFNVWSGLKKDWISNGRFPGSLFHERAARSSTQRK